MSIGTQVINALARESIFVCRDDKLSFKHDPTLVASIIDREVGYDKLRDELIGLRTLLWLENRPTDDLVSKLVSALIEKYGVSE